MGHDLTDYDPLVNEILEKQVPLRLDARGEWAAALRLAGADGAKDGAARVLKDRLRLRSRRGLAPVLGVVLLIIAGATTAAGVPRWWSDLSAIDTNEATSLVEYTLTLDYSVWKAGDTVAIWRMPQPEGGLCVFTARASPKPSAPGTDGPNPAGGGSCSLSGREPEPPAGKPILVLPSASLEGSNYRWLIEGRVSPDSGIAKLELRSANGRIPLAFAHGWFLAQLPSSSSSTKELPDGGPYVLVGYDSRGKPIDRLDVGKARGLRSESDN